jgi:Rieske Fe-S protein
VPEERGRRGFLMSLLGAVGAIIGLGYLFVAERFMLPPPESAGAPQKAGTLDDFPLNQPTLFIYTGEAGFPLGVYITNLGQGKVLALDEHCAHLQCPVQWNSGAEQYLCPCHGSQYNIYGINVGGPAPHPLNFHKVEIRNGNEVWIGSFVAYGTAEWNQMAQSLGIVGKWVPGSIPGTMRWSTNG